jgi:hypothetical protein
MQNCFIHKNGKLKFQEFETNEPDGFNFKIHLIALIITYYIYYYYYLTARLWMIKIILRFCLNEIPKRIMEYRIKRSTKLWPTQFYIVPIFSMA